MWNTILAAIAAAGTSQLVLDGKGAHYALIGLRTMAHRLVNLYLSCGADTCYSTLKESCDECRRSALGGVLIDQKAFFSRHLCGHLRYVAQSKRGRIALSMIGRALPLGTLAKQVKSLDAHAAALLSEHKCDPEILLLARGYARKWSRKHLRSEDLRSSLPLTDMSGGACLTHTRKEGGNF